MSQFTGMNIAEVRTLVQMMNTKADEIGQIAQQLTQKLQGTAWVGQDRERFLSDWQSNHQQSLQRVVESLKEAARRAESNAAEQEQVSNNG